MEIQWTLVFFTLLACMGCGLFAAVCAAGLSSADFVSKKGVLAALILLAAGGFSSLFHLAHLTKAINILTNLNTEFGKEMLLIAAVGVLMLVYLLLIDNAAPGTKKVVCALGIAASAWMAFQSGLTYVLVARASWNTLLLPLAYLASACAFGCIAFCLIVREASDQLQARMRLASFAAIIVQGILYLAYASESAAPAGAGTTAAASSQWSAVFWFGVLLCGTIVPFVLLFPHQKVSGVKAALPLAFCGAAIGGIAFRSMMYLLGTDLPLVL